MTGAAPCRPDVIALVADASATPVACSGADWEKLVADAVQHGLAPLLYRHARHATTPPSQGITGVLRRHYLENAAANMRVFHELADVLSVLGAGGVEAAPLKGACLAERVYGDIALRPMRDIDLLVKLADLTRAIRLLREAGYDASQAFDPRARLADFHDMLPMARPGGSVVEMHWTLVTPQSPARIDDRELEGLWSRTGPETFAGVPARMLAPEDLLLHLCIHASVHHRFSQVRLRAFVDIAEVGRRFKDTLDWAAVAARANRWRVANGVRMALMLAEEWTDLAVPESVWNALDGERPDDEHLIWARHKVREGEPAALRSEFTGVASRVNVVGRISALGKAAFLPRETMARMYRVRSDSWRVLACYPRRLWDLWSRYRGALWKLLVRDRQFVEEIRREARLRKYLGWS